MELPAQQDASQTDRARGAADLSLQLLMAAFNGRIALLQELLLTPRAPSGSNLADLSSVDVVLQGMERQLEAVKAYLRAEAETLHRAKALIALSSQQEQRLQHISVNFPSQLPCSGVFKEFDSVDNLSLKPTDTAISKEKRRRSPPPRWYITVDELDSLSSYMRGRLTLDKINAAVDEMATYADANARLIAAPRKKLGEDLLERVLELRNIAFSETLKGKYFFLESDMRGSVLKLDNTGKAILTVLRHLGRIVEVRTGGQRALVLVKS